MNKEKTEFDWHEEANSFIFNWRQATGVSPTYNDVIKETKGIDGYAEVTANEYAETLWNYISKILEEEAEKNEEDMEI